MRQPKDYNHHYHLSDSSLQNWTEVGRTRLATIWCVRWSKTKYSPGITDASSLSRQRAVSKSFTQSSQTGFPRTSFLNMSSWAEFIWRTLQLLTLLLTQPSDRSATY